jgi:hypothetical protein
MACLHAISLRLSQSCSQRFESLKKVYYIISLNITFFQNYYHVYFWEIFNFSFTFLISLLLDNFFNCVFLNVFSLFYTKGGNMKLNLTNDFWSDNIVLRFEIILLPTICFARVAVYLFNIIHFVNESNLLIILKFLFILLITFALLRLLSILTMLYFFA